jgi:hypothetical protein
VVARFSRSGKTAAGSPALVVVERKSPNVPCRMHNTKDDRLVAENPEIDVVPAVNGKPQAGPDRIARHAGRAITTVYKSMSDCVMRRRPLHGFKVAANLRAEVDSSYNGRSGRYASPARASDCSKSRAEQPSMNAANDILPKA